MPTPILLKKAAGNIKRDRKDVRAVMTVNESKVPATVNERTPRLYSDEYFRQKYPSYTPGYAPDEKYNPYHLPNQSAMELHDLLKENDGRDLGFDTLTRKTENTRTKGFQNPTNLEFYHRNVLSYINPEEVPSYTYDQIGRNVWSWHATPPMANFYIQVVKNARKPDGTWNLKKLEKAALDAYNSRNAPLDSNPEKYVPFSSKWGYETLKLLQNPKEFNESGYKEENYDLRWDSWSPVTYRTLGGLVKTKNRIDTPSKYTPLELNNMHLYSNGRRDMLAPFNDRYPFEPKKPNPYLQNNLNAEKNEVGSGD